MNHIRFIRFKNFPDRLLETYGPEAVKTGDKCFTNETVSGTGSQVPKELGVEGSAGTK